MRLCTSLCFNPSYSVKMCRCVCCVPATGMCVCMRGCASVRSTSHASRTHNKFNPVTLHLSAGQEKAHVAQVIPAGCSAGATFSPPLQNDNKMKTKKTVPVRPVRPPGGRGVGGRPSVQRVRQEAPPENEGGRIA